MSVQCPHCGGEFNLEIKLTTNVIPSCTPKFVPPTPDPKEPKFRVDTPAGKLRRAMWRAGYRAAARNVTIWNDKLSGRRSRLKVSWFTGVDHAQLDPHLRAEFGSDLESHNNYSVGEYVVYFWRNID